MINESKLDYREAFLDMMNLFNHFFRGCTRLQSRVDSLEEALESISLRTATPDEDCPISDWKHRMAARMVLIRHEIYKLGIRSYRPESDLDKEHDWLKDHEYDYNIL